MRILVVKLSSLGDILHVLPTVHAIKEQTGADIDWVVHPEFAQIVHCFKDVTNVLMMPRHAILRDFRKSLKALRATEYDLVVDLHGLFKSGIVTAFARGKRKIGPSYSREFSSVFYGERAGVMHRDTHAAVQAFDTLDYLNLKRPSKAMGKDDFVLPVFDVPKGRPLFAIAPISRWESKNWPKDNFAVLASLIAKELPNAAIAIVGGKADFEVGEYIKAAAPEIVTNYCGKTSISESMALLGSCDLLVANDTGPVHMAAAMGTRCLVLFGPTRALWTGPYGDNHKILELEMACRPCLRHRCPKGDNRCLGEITPEVVLRNAMAMVSEKGGGR